MTTTTLSLSEPLSLPCGARLANRLAKSAMAEGLGTPEGAPTEAFATLYARWARGGAGLLITGNVMVDPTALGEPGHVAVEDERDMEGLSRWAAAATSAGAHCWMQINHPGRQTTELAPVAPSAVPMTVGGGLFRTPRALTHDEVRGLVRRFARTAAVAQAAGFTGVQIHAAHGYLVNQFLSPLTNLRDDEWGGDAARRRRFLIEVVRATREAVGAAFPIGVKLNSADFQHGGFTEDEAIEVARALAAERIDLLEISGGTYERAVMTGVGQPQRESTARREAYFLDFARRVRHEIDVPLMLTGGFRTLEGMSAALADGSIDVVGLARPMAQEPDLPARLLARQTLESLVAPRRIGVAQLDALLEVAWYQHQLGRMGRGRDPDPRVSPWRVLATKLWHTGLDVLRRKRA